MDNLTNPFFILGTKVNPISVDSLHEEIKRIIQQYGKSIITNVNVHAINLAYKYPWFREFINNSDLTFCDGAGVILGAKILGFTVPERITYADWTWQLARFCEQNQFSIYLLGGKPGVSEKAAQKLLESCPKLKIAGTDHGYFEKNRSSQQNREVVNAINQACSDILIVGFGMPLQEKWIKENWQDIEVKVTLTGGAVFDYISGELKRGPKWMTDHGLEWLARLLIEPKRLWKRYLVGNPLFLLRVLLQRLGLLKIS